MVLTYSQFLFCCSKLREQGIVRRSGPLVAQFKINGMYQPSMYHWVGDDTPIEIMLRGPIYHNDNVSYSGRNR